MIKCGMLLLLKPLYKLFNLIYSTKQLRKSEKTMELKNTKANNYSILFFSLMFNLFINDLVKSLETSGCDPIVGNGLSINTLLYADDSEDGLQKSLNCLNEFCTIW